MCCERGFYHRLRMSVTYLEEFTMNKIKNISDRRVLRTKQAIRESFKELTNKYNISEITVTDITNNANINRKTFYNYYADINALIDEIGDEFIAVFEEDLKKLQAETDSQNIYPVLQQLNALIESNYDLYYALFQTDDSINISHKIEQLLKKRAITLFLKKYDTKPEIAIPLCEYCISGTLAIFRYWFNSNRAMPIEELSRQVHLMTTGALHNLLKD